ncbi:Uncharacterised protein [Actinomyces bovis]|uniref:Uncharacterized protein n=1 Tax=Actinomyces bovis TaxID=1658 RepID=A0ABY1VP99_9ACTO|nr:hypothetical protein [Actinomyces bovis]SPT53496.1 Uncharacterised protein [Actinomyces bovis]VEG55405.1 Uncharacterised protein [Actinomyces israelii]
MTMKMDVWPIVTDHLDTLVDQRGDGGAPRRSINDLLLQYMIPVLVGVAVALSSFTLKAPGTLLGGAAILTAFSFGLAIFAFQTRTVDKTSTKGSRRLRLLDEFFANVLYSVIVGIAWTILLVLASSLTIGGLLARAGTGLITTVGLHYLLVLLMCVKRLRAVYRDATR